MDAITHQNRCARAKREMEQKRQALEDFKTYSVNFTPPGTDERGTPEGLKLLEAILNIAPDEDGYVYAAFGPKTQANLRQLVKNIKALK